MLFAILLIAYALPAIVAWSRQHPSRDSVVLLNLFLGWTFLGWLIALLWATSRPVPQRPVAGLK